MLLIRDNHVDNHFSDKFVSMCHVNYFINSDDGVNDQIYLSHFLYFLRLNFVFSSSGIYLSANYIFETKVTIYPIKYI